MIEDRQEINRMLVTMDASELEMVKMFCHGLIANSGKNSLDMLPVLLMMVMPPTKEN